ncbi:MAG: PEP-CTERM sorting domain-containing protein [Pirellulales bacterium]|nr:PEP-CTERM sorting domain-containing protein [Pirellulales bacterium]
MTAATAPQNAVGRFLADVVAAEQRTAPGFCQHVVWFRREIAAISGFFSLQLPYATQALSSTCDPGPNQPVFLDYLDYFLDTHDDSATLGTRTVGNFHSSALPVCRPWQNPPELHTRWGAAHASAVGRPAMETDDAAAILTIATARTQMSLFRTKESLMSRNVFRGLLSAFALVALVSSANAARVDHAVTFDPGSANTYFNATLAGSGSLTLGANLNVQIQTGSILGTPISISAPLTIPNQTLPITTVPNPLNISVDPTGTMTLNLEKSLETFFGAYPNTAQSLKDAEIPQMDLSLVGPGGVGFNTNQIQVSGSASLNILGITTIDIPVLADLTAHGLLSDVLYHQVGGALVTTNGTVTTPPLYGGEPEGSIETTYNPLGLLGAVTSAGTGSANAAVNATGNVQVDLGIFGTVTQDLGTLDLLNEALSLDTLALIFNQMKLRDLEPGVYDGTPRDIRVTMQGNLDILGSTPLEFDINQSLSQPVGIDFKVPVNLGILGSVTLDGYISGTINANIDATFGLTGISYGFEDQVVSDVLVPEPSSMILASVGLVALVPLVWRRHKKS